MSTPIIAFIANKGGTGKTTTCFHIAYELYKEGSRVGIIDADEQCTLTTFALANDTEVTNNNLLTAWETAKECILEGLDVPAATMVVPECVADHKDRKDSNEPMLLLLPGSSDLQLYERQMSSVLTYASDKNPMKPLFKKTPICMRKMLQSTALTYKLDYTLIDMGPCGSPGNFGLFMSCDGFVVPANADHFSKMSISSITKVLKRWSTDQKMLLKRGVRIKGVSPKFIGVAFTRVPTSTKGVPIKVNQQFINESRGAIENVLLPSLVESGMCDEHVIEVGMIPKFSKVHEIAQRCKVPVFAIPVGAMDVNSKGKLVQMAPRALKNAQEQGESYRKHFTDISINIRTFCKKHLVNIGTGDWDVDNKWEDFEEDGCMSDENGKITELETELISKEQTISSLKAEGVAAKALNDDLKKKLERLATELQDKETKILTVIKDKDDSMESLKEKFQSEEKKKDASVQILMKEKNDILTEVAKLTESNKWKCDQISKLEAAAEAETKLKCDVQTKLEEITKQTKLREGQLLKESKDKDLEVSTLLAQLNSLKSSKEALVNNHLIAVKELETREKRLSNENSTLGLKLKAETERATSFKVQIYELRKESEAASKKESKLLDNIHLLETEAEAEKTSKNRVIDKLEIDLKDLMNKEAQLSKAKVTKDEKINSLQADLILLKESNETALGEVQKKLSEALDKEKLMKEENVVLQTKLSEIVLLKNSLENKLKKESKVALESEAEKDAAKQTFVNEKKDLLAQIGRLSESNNQKCLQISKLEAAAEAETKLMCDIQSKLKEITMQTKKREIELLKESEEKDLEVSTLLAEVDSLKSSKEALGNNHLIAVEESQTKEKRLSNENSALDLKLQAEIKRATSFQVQIDELRKESEEASKNETKLLESIRLLKSKADAEKISRNRTIDKLEKDLKDLIDKEAQLMKEKVAKDEKIDSLQADLNLLKVSNENALSEVEKKLSESLEKEKLMGEEKVVLQTELSQITLLKRNLENKLKNEPKVALESEAVKDVAVQIFVNEKKDLLGQINGLTESNNLKSEQIAKLKANVNSESKLKCDVLKKLEETKKQREIRETQLTKETQDKDLKISALLAKIDSLILSNEGLTNKYDAALEEAEIREKRVFDIYSDIDSELLTEVTSLEDEIEELRKSSEEASKREKQLLKCKIDSGKKIRALEIEVEEADMREKRVFNIYSDIDSKLQTEVSSLNDQIEELRKSSEEASKREKQLLKCRMDCEKKIRCLEIEANIEKSSENGTITKLQKHCEDLREVEANLRTELLTKKEKIESLHADLDELKISKDNAIEQMQKALEATKKSETAVNVRAMKALHLASSSLFNKEEQLRSTHASTCVLTVTTQVLSDVVEGDSVNVNCRLGKDIADTLKLDNSQMRVEQSRQKVHGNKSVANEHDNQLMTPHFTESQLMNNWDDVLHTTVNEDMSRKVDCKDAFGGEKRSTEIAVGEKRRIEHELQSGLQHASKVDRSIVLAEELKTQKILEAQKIILSRYRKVSNVMARKLSSLRKGTTLSRKKRRLRE